LEIGGNYIENAKDYSITIMADSEGSPKNIHVWGNTCRKGAAGHASSAIYCEGTEGGPLLEGLRLVDNCVDGGASFGIRIHHASEPILARNRVVNTDTFSIRLGLGCDRAWLDKNLVDADYDLTDATATIIERRRNYGSTGTISTGTTVAHGLGTTPAQIFIDGQIPGEDTTFSNRTETGFDVALTKADMTDGTPQAVTWEAVEEP
jgi:hypothetical protein